MVVALALVSSAVLMASAGANSGGSNEIRLRAQGLAAINGIEAQLQGDFRSSAARQRLSGELKNINLDLGTDISFCLDSGGVTSLQATAPVQAVAGVNIAAFELDTNYWVVVPAVVAGDVLEAHQGTGDCSAPLLISAKFQ